MIGAEWRVDGLGTVRFWARSRLSGISTTLINSLDPHIGRWVGLIQIVCDVPHRKIVGRKVVYGEVAIIKGPARPGTGWNARPASPTLAPRRGSTASHPQQRPSPHKVHGRDRLPHAEGLAPHF